MKSKQPLDYKALRKQLDSRELHFKTTEKTKLLTEFIGQSRALQALKFGIDIKSPGYNLYAMGPPGIGKLSLTRMILDDYAKKCPVPPDWCYIHNFVMPEHPIAVQLPAGEGLAFQQDVHAMVEQIGEALVALFESSEYRNEIKKISKRINAKRREHKKNHKTLDVPYFFKEQLKNEKQIKVKMITNVISPFISHLKKKYQKIRVIKQYLQAMQDDMIMHIGDMIRIDDSTNLPTFYADNGVLIKYRVNLLVNHAGQKGAPVVFEDTPCYSNIICRVEHTMQMGMLVTNFTLIRAGALHRANGGYLIIEMRKLKKNRDAWEALKNALYSRQIKIEPIQNMSDNVKTVSLIPDPIPLDVKVILIGDRGTYYSLSQDDPDFNELFKVPVDFDEEIPRTNRNIQLYACLIGTIAKREKLRHFTAEAVASIIDYSSRLVEDIDKLSTHIRDIEDLILESNYWANASHKKLVERVDVERAIDAQVHRMDRARELYYQDIRRQFIIIKSKGKAIGQVNCLSVRRVGNFSYGHPTRVTARVRVGKGSKLLDIQREIKLAGPLHSKAGLIISNFLASRFSPDHVFSLHASIAFEQVYCWTDGDSASIGELCALLSAITEVPLYQHLAITGSCDQYGEAQAVGGVNEKIEGFFDVCKARGLTGNQGVIIPAVNQKNLMLREDIVKAAKAKQFFIYTVDTVDEAIELLTGMPAGKLNSSGDFPEGSLYRLVEDRLNAFAEKYSKKRT